MTLRKKPLKRSKPARHGNGSGKTRPKGTVAELRRENALLLSEQREAREQQVATSAVLHVINSSPGELESVFQVILENAVRLCEASFGMLFRLEDGAWRAVAMLGVPPPFAEFWRGGPRQVGARTGLGRIAETRRTVHFADVTTEPADPVFLAAIKLGGFRAAIGVPMLSDEDLIGAIFIYRQEVGPFTDKQISLVSSFAAQAVIAMENARLLSELRESLAQQTATAEVLEIINSSPAELQPVFGAMLERAMDLCEAAYGILWTYDGECFHVAQMRGLPADCAAVFRDPVRQPHPEIGLGRILRGERLVINQDMAAEAVYRSGDPIRRAMVDIAGARSAVQAALRKDDAVLGALVIYRKEIKPFTDKQIALLQNFAAQAVIAIENARLLGELHKRTDDLTESLEYQTATSELLEVISRSTSDIQPVFETIMAAAKRLCDAESGGVAVRLGDLFRYVLTRQTAPEPDAMLMAHNFTVDRSTVIGRTALEGQVVHVLDVTQDPEFDTIVGVGGTRTLLGVPLVQNDQVIGVIVLRRRKVEAFSDRQIALVKTFADQAVIAMENARLLNEQREALEQQTATAEVLKVINSSPGDLAPVFDAMLEKAMRLCGAVFGDLRTYDGERFYPVAARGVPDAYIEYYRGHGVSYGPGTGPARILSGERVVHIPDLIDTEAYRCGDPDRRALVDLGKARASLLVPLLKDSKVAGFIMIYRQEAQAFSDKQIKLLQNFAEQAVIAMENARLLGELRQLTDDLTESLEYQTATSELLEIISRSTADVQPVFDTMLASAAQLCTTTIGGVAIRQGDVFRYVASIGRSAKLDKMVRAHVFNIDRSSAIGRVALSRAVVHIPDVQADPDYSAPTTDASGNRTMLGVPLLREGEVIGVIILVRHKVEPFGERQIALVRTFADQAVIAMENARLLSELRESLEQQTATAEVLAAINSSPGDLTPVFESMLVKAHALCGVEYGSLQLYDGTMFRAVAVHNLPEALAARLREGYVPGPAFQRLIEGADFDQTPDVAESDDPTARTVIESGIRTLLRVALRKDGKLLGQIVAARMEVQPFSDKEIALLRSFASQAVIAMENARLLSELRESLEQQTATSEILQVISRSPTDVRPVLDAVARATLRFCDAQDASISLRDGNEWVRAAHQGAFEGMIGERFALNRQSIVGRAIVDARTIHVPDMNELNPAEWPITRQLAIRIGARSFLVVPLLREGMAVGTVSLRRPVPGPFTDKQIELAEAFAAQAVIAIENVRLFTELRESLEQQTATADILKVIASSPDDVQPVFEAIAERSNKLVDGLSTAVYRLVDDIQHLMSFTPTNPEADAALQALFPSPVSTIFSEAIRKGEVFRIADSEVEFTDDPAFRELARLRGWRSVLMVPLLQDGKAIGLITVTRVEPGLFEDQHVELLKTFADQAVIAISNVRLFQEVQQRTRELSASLEDLRAAQSRLIQSEKLASLGQLTAGIAHEIKNPLNFVNNFAGLSGELLQELKETMDSAIAALSAEVQAEIDEVIDTLSNNLAKIVEHGKRADGIVRGMLEHSRGSTGERRSVDVNGLVGEALNLAYHGARAQDQSFSITLKREFGADIAPIDLVPQDMTRVFLNLFGNGFYAARKRQQDGGESAYRPALKIATRDLGDAVEIRVRDNGTGISPEVRGKLFQPFFTTKPTGEGTGLGLSISYDIVTQQHGGSIEVESEPGQFSEFIVRLPRARRTAAGGQ
jgi:GAF domain-containing protein